MNIKKTKVVVVLEHVRESFLLGFLNNINSKNILSERSQNGLEFTLTYKFLQDHFELLFSCFRLRGVTIKALMLTSFVMLSDS